MLENRFVLAGSHVLSAGAPATCVCPSLSLSVCVCMLVLGYDTVCWALLTLLKRKG